MLTREATNQAIHIAKLREDKEKAEIELRALEPSPTDRMPTEDASALLARLPDLSQALHRAPAELKRQVFDAFQLSITYDKVERRIEISATITEAVAQALENAKDLPEGGLKRRSQGHSGGGIRTRDLRVMSPTSYLTAPPRGVATECSNGRSRASR